MTLIDRYLNWLIHNKGRSERTAEKYRGYLDRLATFLEGNGNTLELATLDEIQQFTGLHAHQVMKLMPRARRPLVAALRGFYAWAHKQGHLRSNQAENLEYPKAGRRLPRSISLASAEKLLMACDLSEFIGVRDAAMFGVLIGCGSRISGLVGLNEEDLLWYREGDQERLVIRFREKGEKERLVPAPMETSLLIHAYLGHELLDTIDRTLPSGERVLFVSTANRNIPAHEYYGEHRRIAQRSVFDRMRYYGERCGIPTEQLHPHALRHLFGTEMVEQDVNLFVHQALMGHADPKTTQEYTALAMRKKIEAIDKASPMRNIRTPVTALARKLAANKDARK